MQKDEARALKRVRLLIAIAEAPRFLLAAYGLTLLIGSESTADSPFFDAIHITVEAGFAAFVILKFGRETPRAWYVVAWALAALGVLLAVPALVELVGGMPVEAEDIVLAEAVATTNLFGNAISLAAILAISISNPRPLLNKIEIPHLWGDLAMSLCVWIAMQLIPTIPWADGTATLLLACFVLFLAWRAKGEGVLAARAAGLGLNEEAHTRRKR